MQKMGFQFQTLRGFKRNKNLLAPLIFPIFHEAQSQDLLNAIPSLVLESNNALLMAPFTLHELRTVVFSLPPNKAPRPDGFLALFFQACWDFLGWDLLGVIEESRKSKAMLKYFNTTNIAIIPKVKSPKTFTDFRPVSLCNTIYKIVTKAIYLRMQHMIPKLVSLEKSGFVPG